MNVTQDSDLRGRIGRIETLIEEIERFADPTAQSRAREIVGALLEFHSAALANLLSYVAAAGAPGRLILEESVRDDLVSGLLLLYGLHPHDLDARVARALERVRPQLGSHGGDVELLGIDLGVVRLRMRGACNGCPSSAATLKGAIEAAIHDAAPEVVAIEVEGVVEPALVPIVPLVSLAPTVSEEGQGRDRSV